MRKHRFSKFEGVSVVVEPAKPSPSRYNTKPRISGSLAFAGAEGEGRKAHVNPTSIFYVDDLSDTAIVNNLGGGEFSGTFRGFAENHAAHAVCVFLKAGEILQSSRINMRYGNKRIGGEFIVPGSIGPVFKMRSPLTNEQGYKGDTNIQTFGNHYVIQFTRIARGTKDWNQKEISGNCIRIASSSDVYVGNSDMTLASDQSAGISSGGNYRCTFGDVMFGRPIDRDLHSDTEADMAARITEPHGRGPIVFGAFDTTFLRCGYFELKDRQSLFSLLTGTGHEVSCVIVNCQRGVCAQTKDDIVRDVHIKINAVNNAFVPGPLSSSQGYDHYVKPKATLGIDVYAKGNIRTTKKNADGTYVPRDGPTASEGWGRSSHTDGPVRFVAAPHPHEPRTEIPAAHMVDYFNEWGGMAKTRNPMTGAAIDVRDSLHISTKAWMYNSALMPARTASLSANPADPYSWKAVDPVVPTASMTVAQFKADFMNPWITREFPEAGVTMFTVKQGPNGRTATVLEHFLDDCVFHTPIP